MGKWHVLDPKAGNGSAYHRPVFYHAMEWSEPAIRRQLLHARLTLALLPTG